MNKAEDHSIFTKNIKSSKQNNSNNLSEAVSGTYSSFVNKIKGYVKVNTIDMEANIVQDQNMGIAEKMKKCVKDFFEVEKSYKLFFIVLLTGLALILLSLMFLPIAWLSPHKFVSLFSLGSLVTLFSFIFIYGTSEYFQILFSKNRALFTILFLFSILLGIYFAFNKTYYIISLVCAVVQMITLVVFTLSFIPGGGMGINFMKNMLFSRFISME